MNICIIDRARRSRDYAALISRQLPRVGPSEFDALGARFGWLRRGLVAALAGATLIAIFPASASALVNANPDYWKQTAERRDTVYRLLYSQSPQTIPSTYDPVREAEEILRQQQRSLSPSNPTVRSMWQQIRTITVKQSLSAPLRALGTVGLVSGAFELGWKIGSGINTKFLKIGIPEHTPWNPSVAQQLTFRSKGAYVYSGLAFPYDGWQWEWGSSAYWKAFWVTPVGNGTTQACPASSNPPAVPAGFEDVVGDPHPNCGSGNNGGGNGGVAHVAALAEDALTAPAPIEPYTSQPYDRSSSAPTPPPRTTVESGITQDLDQSANRTLRDWLNYTLGSPGQDDPTGEGQPNPRITHEMPDCTGLLYDVCAQAIRNTGFQGPIDRVNRVFETADSTKPGDAVLGTDPQAGAHVDADGSVTVDANPPAAMMPVVIPGIEPGETYEEYAERLRELELQPAREDATEITMDYGPDGAISTRPGTGTRTHKGTDVVVVTRPRRQRCDLSNPIDEYMVGTGQQTMDLFTGDPPHYPFGANPVFLTPRNLLNPSTVLRWGTSSPIDPPILWDGFGYRHIAAKHGWSPADEAATRDVLTTAQPIAQPGLGFDRWRFVGAPYPSPRDGRPCVRVVIVDYGIAPNNTQPEGIITSYGADPT